MTDKDKFLKLLGGLEKQYRKDIVVQQKLESVYGDESQIQMYDVDALVTPVVEVMADMVPMESHKAMEEIFEFMYTQDFGNVKTTDGTHIRDGEDLWNVLHVSEVVENLKDMLKGFGEIYGKPKPFPQRTHLNFEDHKILNTQTDHLIGHLKLCVEKLSHLYSELGPALAMMDLIHLIEHYCDLIRRTNGNS